MSNLKEHLKIVFLGESVMLKCISLAMLPSGILVNFLAERYVKRRVKVLTIKNNHIF